MGVSRGRGEGGRVVIGDGAGWIVVVGGVVWRWATMVVGVVFRRAVGLVGGLKRSVGGRGRRRDVGLEGHDLAFTPEGAADGCVDGLVEALNGLAIVDGYRKGADEGIHFCSDGPELAV